jgi:glycosyltransferase involved in cell wall biosynthesis
MRIIFLGTMHFHQEYLTAKEFSKMGHEIIYFGRTDSPRYGKVDDDGKFPFKVIKKEVGLQGFKGWDRNCLPGQFDLIYAADHSAAHAAADLQRITGLPMIVSVYDCVVTQDFHGYNSMYEEHVKLLELYKNSSFLFAINPSVAMLLLLKGFTVSYVPHPIDTELYTPYFSADKKEHLVVVSNFYPWKRIDLAIEAAIQMDRELYCIGAGPLLPEIKSLYSKFKKIKFLGEVTDQKKAELISHAKAVIYPQRWADAPGIVSQESFCCGTQAVSFGYPSQRVIDGDWGKYVDPARKDAADQIAGLIDAINSPDKAMEAARDYVVKELSYQVIAKKLMYTITNIMGRL